MNYSWINISAIFIQKNYSLFIRRTLVNASGLVIYDASIHILLIHASGKVNEFFFLNNHISFERILIRPNII